MAPDGSTFVVASAASSAVVGLKASDLESKASEVKAWLSVRLVVDGRTYCQQTVSRLQVGGRICYRLKP